jgi:hypothetical protein
MRSRDNLFHPEEFLGNAFETTSEKQSAIKKVFTESIWLHSNWRYTIATFGVGKPAHE